MAITEVQGIISDPSKLKDIFGSTPNLIDDIVIDVILSETPIYSWDIPKHAVEAGTKVGDSRYKKPISLTLDCILTDPDLSVSGIAKSLLAGENPFTQATWQEKRDALTDLMDQNKFIDVVTPNDTYDGLMITDVKPIFDKDKSKAYFFRVVFEKVPVVSSEIVSVDESDIPVKNKPAAKKTAKKTKAGKKTVQTASEKRSSILNNIVGKYL